MAPSTHFALGDPRGRFIATLPTSDKRLQVIKSFATEKREHYGHYILTLYLKLYNDLKGTWL
jgi:hypothetical protein